jgi:RNA polymerase sigma-70 factor, ECF subfamily
MNQYDLAFGCHPPPGPGQPAAFPDHPAGEDPRGPTDAELMAGAQAEFGLLFDRYAPRLYSYAAHRVGVQAAEDVVSETFLIAYQRRHRFDPDRPSAAPWLYGIATNLVHRRRNAEARAHRDLAELDTAVGTAARGGEDIAERAAERADAQALVRTIADALSQLSRRHRDVLYLLAAGLGHDEIAAALGVSSGTVRSRLHRARTHLRQIIVGRGIAIPETTQHRGDHQ